MPLISVIVPVYKVEAYLHRCVDSILKQTLTDFELILVDDGSPDNCGAICDEYAKLDCRVQVIHQKNGGLSAARNAGIDWAFANSDSQWLTFIDSDDWVHPKMLERLYHVGMEFHIPISICSYANTEKKHPKIEPDQIKPQLWNPKDFFIKKRVNATVAWGKLYRKECFTDIRYPIGKIHEDEYVTYRILFKYNQIGFIDTPYYMYFFNEKGITKSAWTPERLDCLGAFEAQIEFFKGIDDKELVKYSQIKYLRMLTSQMCEIKNLNVENGSYRSYKKLLQKKLRRGIIKNYKNVPICGNEFVYETAFPKTMSVYWFIRAQLQKIPKLRDSKSKRKNRGEKG